MAIKGLLFDLDVTLADTLPSLAEAVNFALEKEGFLTHPVTEYVNFIGNGSKVLIRKALPEGTDEEVQKKTYGIYLDYYLSHLSEKTRPFSGMKEALTRAKSRKMILGCITNKPEEAAKRLIEDLFPGLFDIVVGSVEGRKNKPDPAGIESVIASYGLKKDEVIYFGDSDVDLILASNAGLPYKVGVGWGYRPLKELLDLKPYMIIYRPLEIDRLIT